jgi:hypothetical protein
LAAYIKAYVGVLQAAIPSGLVNGFVLACEILFGLEN